MSAIDASAAVELMEVLTAISVRAALAIRSAGRDDVRLKADNSPVTAADIAAEGTIRDGLARLAPALPVISEEQTDREPSPAADAAYFLVDPLDGTREFIAERDEYTTNIALMSVRRPLLGVISAPALGLIWRGILGHGAERMTFTPDGAVSAPSPIHTAPRPQGEWVVVVSRSHFDSGTQAYMADHVPRYRLVSCGSSMKFCRVAEGLADLYPRLIPAHDWDVAAGHAILQAAGGNVLSPAGKPLVYGSAELLIPAFIASGGPAAP